jgi:hypothetical protein
MDHSGSWAFSNPSYDHCRLAYSALASFRMGCLQSQSERQHESWKLEIKRVNFLAADVAQEQRGIIRSQAAPGSGKANR